MAKIYNANTGQFLTEKPKSVSLDELKKQFPSARSIHVGSDGIVTLDIDETDETSIKAKIEAARK